MSEPSELPSKEAAQPAARRKSSLVGWPAAISIIALGFMGLAGFVFKSCQSEPAKIVESVAKAIQPQINVKTIIQTSLNRLRDESKLVVYTADVAVMVTKYSEK